MKIKLFTVLIICFAFLNTYAGGFSDLGNSARVSSMGGASLTLTDAPYLIFYNPANLYKLNKPVISTTYSNLYPNVEGDNLNFISLSGIVPLDFIGVLGLGGNFLNTDLWKEYTLAGAYSRELIENLSVGGTFKVIGWSAAAAPGESALSYTGFAVDAGVYYALKNLLPSNSINFGLSVQNINQPSIASSGSDGKLPMRVGLGVGIESSKFNYLIALDVIKESDIIFIKGGAEFLGIRDQILGYETQFLLRMGYNNILQSDFAREGGINGGFGLVVDKVKIDYGYIFPLVISNTGGINRISLTYNF